MSPESPTILAIERIAGVSPPNQVALAALAELEQQLAALTALRSEMTFEAEPSSFDQALLDCREPSR